MCTTDAAARLCSGPVSASACFFFVALSINKKSFPVTASNGWQIKGVLCIVKVEQKLSFWYTTFSFWYRILSRNQAFGNRATLLEKSIGRSIRSSSRNDDLQKIGTFLVSSSQKNRQTPHTLMHAFGCSTIFLVGESCICTQLGADAGSRIRTRLVVAVAEMV